MNKSIWAKINKYSKKMKAIHHLGGSCITCGENNHFKLSFHHIDDKEFGINLIKGHRWSKILKEINKCQLLCHNCHMEHHHLDIDSRHQKNKKFYLEIKGTISCERCGYDRSKSALEFHHTKNKLFKISSLNKELKNIGDVENFIIDEISKCEVLCTNCHIYHHSDVSFYEEYFDKIKYKCDNLREINKIDENLVISLYRDGIRTVDISRRLNCRRESIYLIIKKFNK